MIFRLGFVKKPKFAELRDRLVPRYSLNKPVQNGGKNWAENGKKRFEVVVDSVTCGLIYCSYFQGFSPFFTDFLRLSSYDIWCISVWPNNKNATKIIKSSKSSKSNKSKRNQKNVVKNVVKIQKNLTAENPPMHLQPFRECVRRDSTSSTTSIPPTSRRPKLISWPPHRTLSSPNILANFDSIKMSKCRWINML